MGRTEKRKGEEAEWRAGNEEKGTRIGRKGRRKDCMKTNMKGEDDEEEWSGTEEREWRRENIEWRE